MAYIVQNFKSVLASKVKNVEGDVQRTGYETGVRNVPFIGAVACVTCSSIGDTVTIPYSHGTRCHLVPFLLEKSRRDR